MKFLLVALALLGSGQVLADCKMKVSIYGGPSKDIATERADSRRVRGTVARVLRDKGYTPYEVPYDSRAYAWDGSLEISFFGPSSPGVITNSQNNGVRLLAIFAGALARDNGGIAIQYSLKGARLAGANDFFSGDPRDIRVKLASLEAVLEEIPVSRCY